MLTFLPDLKKSDIFSLGITAYELITLESLEKNGKEWDSFRDGTCDYPQDSKQIYTNELLETVRLMLGPQAQDRPSA